MVVSENENDDESLDISMDDSTYQEEPSPAPKKTGRPPGAKNKRTISMVS
jgi:hypothetical protein